MSTIAIALAAALEITSPETALSMTCGFPAASGTEDAISVDITAAPSLRDWHGSYRVRMALNGSLELAAKAEPMSLSDGRAVLIGGSASEQVYYTIGLHENGTAAITIHDAINGAEVTRSGTCRHHERYLRLWMPN